RVVGVQGAEDQVTRQRRLDGNLSGIEVAHFADEDDIRVMTQNAAHGGGEGQANLRMHLNLADSRLLILDGVLDGDDLGDLVLDLVEGRVQRGGLAGASRTGHQDYAVRPVDQLLEDAVNVRQKADIGEVEDHAALVQKPQHQPLAVDH